MSAWQDAFAEPSRHGRSLEGRAAVVQRQRQRPRSAGSVARSGLCGDVFLDVHTARSAYFQHQNRYVGPASDPYFERRRRGPGRRSARTPLSAVISRDGQPVEQFRGKTFGVGRGQAGTDCRSSTPGSGIFFWDIHTPAHQYDVVHCRCWMTTSRYWIITLPVRFGFREFWIDGRDFYLNGTRIYLSAVPLDNAQVGSGLVHLSVRPGKSRAAEKLRDQFRLHAQLRVRTWLASQFHRDPAGRG